jgi:HAD superfamily hydrolase (TIGR01549 family)
MSKPLYKGLIFDMGDVLYDASGWRLWLFGVLSQLRLFSTFQQMEQIWESYLINAHKGLLSWDEALKRFLHSLELPPSKEKEIISATTSYRSAQKPLILFDGVQETLRQLTNHGRKLAVLSDTESPSSVVYQRLAGAGIGDHFEGIICSFDTGTCKPDPTAYFTACNSLDIPAKNCVFIGHDQEELDGASNAGITTIAFNHASGVKADYQVDHFTEILDVVLCN